MPGNYVLLETIDLTQSAASVTFDNIPQSGYTDLKFVMSARQSTAAVAADVLVTFNGNAANNSNRYLLGDSASASSGFNGYTPSSNYISIGVGNNATANTFSSVEMYIPNYLSSNSKSFSVDSVSESNATSSVFQLMLAGLWSSSSAINQITVTPASSQSFLQYSTFSLYGLAAVGTTPTVAPKATGGNIVANDGTYWYHAFLTSGTFTPQTALACDYLVVAGGGGGGGVGNGTNGGYPGAGGGGAGGYRLLTSQALTASTNYATVIGSGGAGKTYTLGTGGIGNNSSFNSTISAGGGGGASHSGTALAGGSGGGASSGAGASTTGGAGNTPSTSPSQGNNGGSYTGGDGAGGGGGASATGSNNSGLSGGAGGAGSNSAATWATVTGTGINGYYAGGGGGGSYSGGSGGAGGAGGGGKGGTYNTSDQASGIANTGGGGGGAAMSSPTVGLTGGNGASGIIIIRYAI